MTMTTTDTTVNGTSTAAALAKAKEPGGSISAFSDASNFATAQRMATALAQSSMVPKEFQGNLPNCLIALELASRIGASIFAVMQNLDIIHGKPSFRATFLIATVNACGRFTPLRFRWVGERGTDSFGCYAVAKDRETGEECIGTEITVGMAKSEGWYARNGSKWKTLTNQMLCYRAAAFWQRLYAPELGLGMSTSDEVIDTEGYAVEVSAAEGAKALEAELLAPAPQPKTPAAPPADARPAPAKVDAEAKPKRKDTKAAPPPPDLPDVEVDPLTGEIVPPPNAGDAWECPSGG